MPNPLIGAARLNTGKRADERPHAIPPTPEAYAGDNNPYRGIESHGVAPTAPPEEFRDDEWDDTVSGIMVPDKQPVDPIPVEVVKKFSRELRRFQSWQAIVPGGGQVISIAGRNNARSRLTVKVIDAAPATVWIGNTESISSVVGAFPLSAAEKIIDTEDAVYACRAAGDATAITVYVLEEFVVREP